MQVSWAILSLQRVFPPTGRPIIQSRIDRGAVHLLSKFSILRWQATEKSSSSGNKKQKLGHKFLEEKLINFQKKESEALTPLILREAA